MSSDYDVIIAGAGPAGTSAAICCARDGLKTLLVERSNFPRHRPGETLHPGVLALFEKLNVRDDILTGQFIWHSGIHVHWGNFSKFVPFGADSNGLWLGLSIPRAELDQILLQRASADGAALLQPCAVHQPILSNTRVIGIRCDAGDITSRFTIDATGSRHWLATSQKLPLRRHSPRLIATYGYCHGDPSRLRVPTIEGDSDGWTWIAPIPTNLYAWTRLLFEGVNRRVPDSIADLCPMPPDAGADVSWRSLDRAAGDGFFVTGDAASVIDPAGSTGVLKALMSGIYAAELITGVLEEKITEQAAAFKYRVWSNRFFNQKAQQLAGAYAKLRNVSSVSKAETGLG